MKLSIQKFLLFSAAFLVAPIIAMEQGVKEKTVFIEDGIYRAAVTDSKTEKICTLNLGTVADIERTGEIIRGISPYHSKYSNDELLTTIVDHWCYKTIPFIPYATIYFLRKMIGFEEQINAELVNDAAFYDALIHLARHNPEHGALYLFGGTQARFKKYLAKTDQVSFDTLRAAFSDLPLRPVWRTHIQGFFSAINRKDL